jgi:hypothetical protein
MKTIIAFLLFSSFVIFPCFSPPECGGLERWDVKNLTDEDAKNINFKAIKITIDSLRKISPGKKIGKGTKRFGIEFQTYEVTCTIREYRNEDDGDYHLVLVDVNDTSKTMIGEIPDPFCPSVSKSSRVKTFINVRTFFKDSVVIKKNKTRQGVYRIKGVAFYDKKHGQLGIAPNGIELHPILYIKSVKK